MRVAMFRSRATRLSFTWKDQVAAQFADHGDGAVHHKAQLGQVLPHLVLPGDLYRWCTVSPGFAIANGIIAVPPLCKRLDFANPRGKYRGLGSSNPFAVS